MITMTWLYEYIWYESVRNSLEFLGETSGSCFSGRDVSQPKSRLDNEPKSKKTESLESPP